ncbi:MAG: PhzF family phenazine biosynthesis protein [Bacteroidota bacterium]|nr:PhzF family phenazine biosynthesis protein [Bacteroidota bacterium]
MTNHVTLYQVDAFTAEPFKGNPAGVCILEKEMPDGWMQNIAMEMNLSETAFITPSEGLWKIRYFTPAAEIPLCGHATLGSAHLMFETSIVGKDREIIFSSKAGKLAVKYSDKWIVMNFPAYESRPAAIPPEAAVILGIKPLELYRTDHGWALVILDNETDVKNLRPDFKAMKDSEFGDLIVAAPSSDPEYDFCVRCFAPALGIDEDPVTGSAQSALVPLWYGKTGKKSFITHQVSKRGGVLKASLINGRVEIEGQARTIFKAELLI